jgi:hypothetical protein
VASPAQATGLALVGLAASAAPLLVHVDAATNDSTLQVVVSDLSSTARSSAGKGAADNSALIAEAGVTTLTDADREMLEFAMSASIEEIDFSQFFIDDDD